MSFTARVRLLIKRTRAVKVKLIIFKIESSFRRTKK